MSTSIYQDFPQYFFTKVTIGATVSAQSLSDATDLCQFF